MLEYKRLEAKDSESLVSDMNRLYSQLSSNHKEIKKEAIEEVLKNENSVLYGAFDGEKLVGVASLHIVKMIAGIKGLVEEVVVDEDYRRQGIAKEIMKMLLDEGTKRELKYIDLTSNPKREAANKLYQSLGFDQRETNVYRFSVRN